MQALRTPDERFAALPGWAWRAAWFEHAGFRVAVVDEGPKDRAPVALCLHGNPSWGYLYRHMLPQFLAAGLRVVVPDLIGFGRSDKPVDDTAHTFALHRGMLLALVDALDLRDVMLVCQDWGGILGLTLPMARPARFTRLLAMNTALPTGETSEGFRQWRAYSNAKPDLAVGALLSRGKPDMTPAEAAAYDAPFPDLRFKAALRAFPNLVPDVERDGARAPEIELGRAAQRFWRDDWRGESFVAIGLRDPVLGEAPMRALAAGIRGCPPPMALPEAGHFVPEWGAPVASAALAHFGLADPGAAVRGAAGLGASTEAASPGTAA